MIFLFKRALHVSTNFEVEKLFMNRGKINIS